MSETKKAFGGKNWGKDQIELFNAEGAVEYRPTSIHLKEDGAADNGASFCIVMEHYTWMVYGQISLKMLNEGLADVGYKIVEI